MSRERKNVCAAVVVCKDHGVNGETTLAEREECGKDLYKCVVCGRLSTVVRVSPDFDENTAEIISRAVNTALDIARDVGLS